MKNARIVVLTYDIPHRKTYDTLCLLRAEGYKEVKVYGIPLQYKKKFMPLIQHRPETFVNISPDELCANLEYEYQKIETYDNLEIGEDSLVLVCGAGLLPEKLVNRYRIINAHPGYIPDCRGLDAFKWAIYEGKPIGVTAHLLGNEVDAGEIIIRKRIPVYVNDTFHALAQRVYENEIVVLVKAIECLCRGEKTKYFSGGEHEVHKRMGHEMEMELFNCFEKYKEQYFEKS